MNYLLSTFSFHNIILPLMPKIQNSCVSINAMAKVRDILLEHYTFAFVITAIIMLLALLFGGGQALVPIVALAAIEITFSFENAVINSEVLSTMHRFWRLMFLTVGIAIAVFGVRLLLPLLLVSLTAGHSMSAVLDSALHHPEVYAQELEAAYPIIAAFGGVFLLMIGLRFFGEKKDVLWINGIESPVAAFNQPWALTIGGASLALAAIYFILDPGDKRTLMAGLLGALTFIAVKAVSRLLLRGSKNTHNHGLMQFIYLELLDASFSFDGVIAAFAITKEIILIAAGLGIGALYVRSMTVHLLKAGTLKQYRYLIHGAHYAIAALAILLLAGIRYHIPEGLTGVLGLVIIGLAFQSSRQHNRTQTL